MTTTRRGQEIQQPHQDTVRVVQIMDGIALPGLQVASKRPRALVTLAQAASQIVAAAREAVEEEEFRGNELATSYLASIRESAGAVARTVEEIDRAYERLGQALNQLYGQALNGTPGNVERNGDLPPTGRLQTGLRGYVNGVPQPEAPEAPGSGRP